MTGYFLEFKRNYSPADTEEPHTVIPVGNVDSAYIVDSTTEEKRTDYTPSGKLEIAASEVPTPGISENFLAPVNDVSSNFLELGNELLTPNLCWKTTNKRCQEWTMEFIRHLVSKRLIDSEAIRIVQLKRDPPTHGIGLKAR